MVTGVLQKLMPTLTICIFLPKTSHLWFFPTLLGISPSQPALCINVLPAFLALKYTCHVAGNLITLFAYVKPISSFSKS